MITVWGEGRGFRVAWLLEELGLPYRVRPVDLLAELESDAEFLAVNPAGYIPALVDGPVTMVESIAIMQYLLARYGSTELAPAPGDANFACYLQFLHLGEAGLALPVNAVTATKMLAPESEKRNWTARWAMRTFESRRGLVARQLQQSPYVAGDAFTAADISVTYAFELAVRTIGVGLTNEEAEYVRRTTGRDAYSRAMDSCVATKSWVARLAAT